MFTCVRAHHAHAGAEIRARSCTLILEEVCTAWLLVCASVFIGKITSDLWPSPEIENRTDFAASERPGDRLVIVVVVANGDDGDGCIIFEPCTINICEQYTSNICIKHKLKVVSNICVFMNTVLRLVFY